MSEPEPPRRRAWPFGLLLSIVQIGLVWALMALFGKAVDTLFPVVFLLGIELIVGFVLLIQDLNFQGRVLIFAAIFPVALTALLLLVTFTICIFSGGKL